MKKYYFLLFPLMVLATCSKDPGELNVPQPGQDQIYIQVSRNNVAADNYSYAEIMVTSQPGTASGGQLTFTADRGTFSNGANTITVSRTGGDTSYAYLRFNKPESVRVTVTLSGRYTKETLVNFVTSFPTSLQINTDSSTLTPLFSSKTLVTVQVSRINGVTTAGLPVVFYDSTANGSVKSIGVFLNAGLLNDQGVATAQYVLQDTSYHAPVYLIGYVQGTAGRISGMNRIVIRKQ